MQVHRPTTPAAFVPSVPGAGALDPQMSVLVLADRLLTLAQDAERAGLMDTADHLVRLAHDVFDEEAGSDTFDGGIEAGY